MTWIRRIINFVAYAAAGLELLLRSSRTATLQLSSSHIGDRRNGMLLSDREIKQGKLVRQSEERNFRATSYDLRVGNILTVVGEEVNEFTLEPSGVAEVVSRERIVLPKDVTALAMVKTDLCNKGILALNIGIVGPGYDGYLSTTLLNFSKREFRLTKDEVFLRLVFQECYISPREKWPAAKSHEDYLRDKKMDVVNFSSKFLNLDEIVKEISKPILGDFRDQALKFVTVLVLTLSVLTFFLTIGVNFANRIVWTEDTKKESIKSEILKELAVSREGDLRLKIKELEQTIERVKAAQNEDALSGRKE